MSKDLFKCEFEDIINFLEKKPNEEKIFNFIDENFNYERDLTIKIIIKYILINLNYNLKKDFKKKLNLQDFNEILKKDFNKILQTIKNIIYSNKELDEEEKEKLIKYYLTKYEQITKEFENQIKLYIKKEIKKIINYKL